MTILKRVLGLIHGVLNFVELLSYAGRPEHKVPIRIRRKFEQIQKEREDALLHSDCSPWS